MTTRVYGSAYDSSLSNKEIAKRIRAEIRQAIKAGTLPAGRYSVTSDHLSVDCHIRHLEAVSVLNPERVRLEKAEPFKHCELAVYNETGARIIETIERMLAAYNYDGSDTMTDYFDVNFYSNVCFDFELTNAERDRINNGQEPAATTTYVAPKRQDPKPKPATSDLISYPITGTCEPIEAAGKTWTVERIDESAQPNGYPVAYVITSPRGAKVALKRYGAGNPNMWPSNADIMKSSCPLDGHFFNDTAGTLAIGYDRKAAAAYGRQARPLGGC